MLSKTGGICLRNFFRLLRRLLVIALICFGVWLYSTDTNVRYATNDSLNVLFTRINQLIATGSLQLPKEINQIEDHEPTATSKDKPATWSKATASVFLNLDNNQQLKAASLDAINVWNQTGAFRFVLTNQKKTADIVISTVDDPNTNAAGQTSTTYNPVTGHLLHATVHLNRYYLQNPFYGYNHERIVNTAEHELGHAMGLSHTNGVSVMYPKGSIYTIQPNDITTLKKLYHEK